MYFEFLKPEVFDAIIVANIAIGLLIAARRFRRDISGPLPEDAPQSAHDAYESAMTSSAPSSDS